MHLSAFLALFLATVHAETFTMPGGQHHTTRTIHRASPPPPSPCPHDDVLLPTPTLQELDTIRSAPFPRPPPNATDMHVLRQIYTPVLSEIHQFTQVTSATLTHDEIDTMIRIYPGARSMPNHVMHQIVPGLFLGSERAVNHTELRIHGIHILINASTDDGFSSEVIKRGTSQQKFENYVHVPFHVIQAPVNLHADSLADRLFPSVAATIDKALNQRERVLVFCKDGIARSTTLVASYLMVRYNLTAAAAMTHVQWLRAVSVPSHPFVDQLVKWEEAHVRVHTDVYHGGLRLMIRESQKREMREMEVLRENALFEMKRLSKAGLTATKEFELEYTKATSAIIWVNRWRALLGLPLENHVSIRR